MNKLIEARYYTAEAGGKVRCRLCPHNCLIAEGKTGTCGIRTCSGGRLHTVIYGELTALAMDPIEKKPLYHFFPGSSILSVGTKGCNFKCSYCQNWNISQDLQAHTDYCAPADLVTRAAKSGSIGIAYTYSEPLIWFEYVLDCSKLAHERGLKNVLVTNGYVNHEPLEELLEFVDAMNIDLKSFRNDSYKKIQKGSLDPVLETIKTSQTKCHVELTTLVVTGMNDDMNEMKDSIDWIASVDRSIPWHISRYFPNYRYDAPPTDTQFIYRVHEEAIKKLDYVYCGNISGSHASSDTRCPSCQTTVITRAGYHTHVAGLKKGVCGKCGHDLRIQM
jgi:pyruvate formate lyase activating enzyme